MSKFRDLKVQDKIATIILWLFGGLILLFIVYNSILYYNYFSFHTIGLGNADEKSLVAEIFNVKQSDNIDIVSFGFDGEDGTVYLLITDITDLSVLLEYNVLCTNIEEKDQILSNALFFEDISKDGVYSRFFQENCDGVTIYQMGKNVELSDIGIFKRNGKFYCELKKDWDYNDGDINEIFEYLKS